MTGVVLSEYLVEIVYYLSFDLAIHVFRTPKLSSTVSRKQNIHPLDSALFSIHVAGVTDQ